MTREEAADLLDNLIGMVEDNQENDYDTAIKIAIKALNIPDTNVGDTISRQAAIDALVKADYEFTGILSEPRARRIEQTINALPSAQRKGKWIDDTYCSECGWANEVESGFVGSVKGFKFCPNCMADMKGESDGANNFDNKE